MLITSLFPGGGRSPRMPIGAYNYHLSVLCQREGSGRGKRDAANNERQGWNAEAGRVMVPILPELPSTTTMRTEPSFDRDSTSRW
jgi:hypothetical protein